MPSQFQDIVNHKEKMSVKCVYCDVWVAIFVWNFNVALWNFMQTFQNIHRKMCILRDIKKFTIYDILELWHLKSWWDSPQMHPLYTACMKLWKTIERASLIKGPGLLCLMALSWSRKLAFIRPFEQTTFAMCSVFIKLNTWRSGSFLILKSVYGSNVAFCLNDVPYQASFLLKRP